YYAKYPGAPNRNDALTDMYKLIQKENTIAAYAEYYAKYPEAPNRNDALTDMYKLVKQENNVAGYFWFLTDYSDAPQAIDALQRMHAIAFGAAKQVNTVEAYNDFVITYPTSNEVSHACYLANELETVRYNIGTTRDEKEDQARLLLNRSHRIWLDWQDKESSPLRHGYLLIVQRMNELLETVFPAQKATSEMLESEKTRRFRKELRESLDRTLRALNQLQTAVAHLTAVMQQCFGIMTDLLRSISSSTRVTAANTGAIAQDTRIIASDVGTIASHTQTMAHSMLENARNTQRIAEQMPIIADGIWENARNTRAIANDTWEVVGRMPQIVDTLNRQAQSLEYANWHRGQFQRWFENFGKSETAGSEMVKNPLFPERSWLMPLKK
ncbi:MAG: hypothetical protein FWE95_00795, partial [Planctomycetaceae bacterium]|nr:hypothetical protein [Planctomycetaceae bacterium]